MTFQNPNSQQTSQNTPQAQPVPQDQQMQQTQRPSESQVKTCEKCNKEFRIIKQELEFLNSKQLPLPTMCPSCRQERRMSLRNPRQLIKANCDKCGKEIITTPKSNPQIKVYCDECYKEYLNAVDPIIK
jgi:protein-arginine kinase activator protein McsA